MIYTPLECIEDSSLRREREISEMCELLFIKLAGSFLEIFDQ